MESLNNTAPYGEVRRITGHTEVPLVLIICEHASYDIPSFLSNVGVSSNVCSQWNIDALSVAEAYNTLNALYSVKNSVPHTLDFHSTENGLMNMMTEIQKRSDPNPAVSTGHSAIFCWLGITNPYLL